MRKWISSSALIAAALAWPLGALAEDIDLFMGPTPPQDTSAPNVLFVIDNTGNWTAPFEDEKAALKGVFQAIQDRLDDPEDSLAVNIGIMMFSETGGDDDEISGAYVRAAVRPMNAQSDDGTDYTALYADLIEGFHERDDKANSGAAGLAMAEAYYYFAGMDAYAGNNKAKTDWGGAIGVEGVPSNLHNEYMNSNETCCVESHPVWALDGNALDRKDSTTYNSPIATGSCGKNYIIWISNGATQDPSAGGSDSIPKQLLDAAIADLGTGDGIQIGLSPSGSEDTWADEWARFMYQSPEAVTTFTVDVLPKSTGQGPGWSRLLLSMAEESNGKAYTVDDPDAVAEQLVAAINDAIDRILAVNTVFASVALPAASNAQSTFLNQVFIGQFRPDKDAHPRWPGNLKQYKLGIVGADLKVLDADGDAIVDPGTGFIEKCAKSYWSTADSYWSGNLALDLEASQVCTEGGSDSTESNAPDGPLVEKGAQGQQLRAIAAADRTVYTCSPTFATCSSTSTLASFATGNGDITDTLLGVASGDRDDTINWGRGADIDDEDGDGSSADIRATVHGDVVHSRPVAVNYGTDAAPAVVVFYSANDGLLRAINGNRPDVAGINNTPSGKLPGQEIWSFMPPEFYPYIDVLRQNDDIINFPSSSLGAPTSGISKPYGVDGPLTAFEGYVPDAAANKKYLYAGMRRTGRALYAFDVTNIQSPTMLWKKGCSHLDPTDLSNVCTTGWEDIGQTWSQPSLLYANGYADGSGNLKPMLIVGGGYDDCEDYDNDSSVTPANHSCTAGLFKGNKIYLLDAHTGTIKQTFSTDRPVVGAVTVVPYSDNLSSGIAYAYATDTGGNIYRISGSTASAAIGTTAPGASAWTITKIAALGCDSAVTCTGNRKFLFGPDVVLDPSVTGQYAVLVGSGDREKPLTDYGAAEAVQNYFFALFDQPGDTTWLSTNHAAVAYDTSNCGGGFSNVSCLSSLTPVSITGPATGKTVGPKGWRFPLAAGEQVVTGAITVADVANFSTHIPAQPTDACASDLGRAFSYNLDFKAEAEGDKNEIVKGGLVPTPVAGMVILDDGKKVPFCIGCGGEDSAIGAKLVGSGIKWNQPKNRVYWNIQQ